MFAFVQSSQYHNIEFGRCGSQIPDFRFSALEMALTAFKKQKESKKAWLNGKFFRAFKFRSILFRAP